MNTKLIMTFSAIMLGIVGISLTFLPQEISIYFDLRTSKLIQTKIQILGALYFSFAMLNWMTKASFIGGVYNRPIVIANLTHFMIGSITLVKHIISSENLSVIFVILTTLYSLLTILFGRILFRHPGEENTKGA
ncbi:MAG: hypothetical protein PF445_01885 [Melioribacteraceae bacterium]|jgi:hypothetical protein|nr:hypothetical protein [Melioribacteraceae bacterium]